MTANRNQAPATPDEVGALFSRRSTWETWLEIEASLAEVQAELGIIPEAAAAEIRAKANFDAIDLAALAADIERTRAPIMSLVRALANACEGGAGGYVHWGATTQNVMQTACALQMKRAHLALMRRFDDVLAIMADLAEAEAETVTVARTNMRHALPVTFGFKMAAWIEEWLRQRERLGEVAPRALRAQWGGTVGAMHVLGAAGPNLNRCLAERLGLGWFTIPSRAALDGFAEYALTLSLLAATCGKIARTLYLLMADEVDELGEELGVEVVGSSTMPHKVNPKIVVKVIALAARLKALAPLGLDAMQPSHEGDAASNMMITRLIEEACPLAFELVDQMAEMLAGVGLRPDSMRRNLALSGELLASENVMMTLAPAMGRNRAHDTVHDAILRRLDGNASIIETLLVEGALPAEIEEASLRAAADPARYLGQSVSLAGAMVAEARKVLAGRRRS